MSDKPEVPKKKHRRYRKVLTRMWGDEKFQELSRPKPNGQSLWQYLITGPHTIAVPGLFSTGEAALAEALGWPLPAFRRCWQEIESRGMAKADWRARVIWLPNAIRHNAPENPNVVKSWREPLDHIPACALKTEALIDIKVFLGELGEVFLEAFRESFDSTFAIPLRNQEAGAGAGSRN